MPADQTRKSASYEPATYEIRVEGSLRAGWSDRLGGLRIAPQVDDPRTTVLAGMLPDQSALIGVLKGLHDLGLPIVWVQRLEDEDRAETRG
ncbi:MAG TPA: hypothetical protein VH482_03695 [Thermomicrobiales bacterium]|jgi:hypothetical protein